MRCLSECTTFQYEGTIFSTAKIVFMFLLCRLIQDPVSGFGGVNGTQYDHMYAIGNQQGLQRPRWIPDLLSENRTMPVWLQGYPGSLWPFENLYLRHTALRLPRLHRAPSPTDDNNNDDDMMNSTWQLHQLCLR